MLWNIKCELQTGLFKSRRSPLSHHKIEARQSAGRWASHLAWSPRKYYTASDPATSLAPSCFPRGFITKEIPARCINRHHCMKGCHRMWTIQTERAFVKTKQTNVYFYPLPKSTLCHLYWKRKWQCQKCFSFLNCLNGSTRHPTSGKKQVINRIMHLCMM